MSKYPSIKEAITASRYEGARNYQALDWLKAFAIRSELSSCVAEGLSMPESTQGFLFHMLENPISPNLSLFPALQIEVEAVIKRRSPISAVDVSRMDFSLDREMGLKRLFLEVDFSLPDRILVPLFKEFLEDFRVQEGLPKPRTQRYRWECFCDNGALIWLDARLYSEFTGQCLTWEGFVDAFHLDKDESTVRKQCGIVSLIHDDAASFRAFKEQAYMESGKKKGDFPSC